MTKVEFLELLKNTTIANARKHVAFLMQLADRIKKAKEVFISTSST